MKIPSPSISPKGEEMEKIMFYIFLLQAFVILFSFIGVALLYRGNAIELLLTGNLAF